MQVLEHQQQLNCLMQEQKSSILMFKDKIELVFDLQQYSQIATTFGINMNDTKRTILKQTSYQYEIQTPILFLFGTLKDCLEDVDIDSSFEWPESYGNLKDFVDLLRLFFLTPREKLCNIPPSKKLSILLSFFMNLYLKFDADETITTNFLLSVGRSIQIKNS